MYKITPMDHIPRHIESEQALLGTLLSGHYTSASWVDIRMALKESDFYTKSHRILFTTIDELDKANRHIDAVTVAEHLSQTKQLEMIGGASYIKELLDQVISPSHIPSYVEIIKEKSKLRDIINFSTQITSEAKAQSFKDFNEFTNSIEEKLLALHEVKKEDSLEAVGDLIEPTVEKLEQLSAQGETVIGIPSGFLDLDDLTSGLHPGEMTVIAARPSVGKTAFGINIAQHAALREKKKVAFFSLEMSKETVLVRFLSLLSKVSLSKLRSGQLNKKDWSSVMKTLGKIEKCPLYINDLSGIDPYEMRTQCRHMKIKHGLDLIIVDYLQMMSLQKRTESREREVSEISKALKALAKELKVPVVALAQLNRSVEGRSDKKPLLSDLRESGSIEQDSDVIMLMYRDSYYNKEINDNHITEIIIGKQRNGPTGVVKLKWNPEFGLFEDYKENLDPHTPFPEGANFSPSFESMKDFSPTF